MPPTTLHQPYTLSLSSLCIGIPLGLCIGAVNTLIIQRLLHTFIGFLSGDVLSSFVTVFVSGIIAGAIQGAFLRPSTRPVAIWLVASGMGWSVAYGLMRYFYATIATATILPPIAEVSLGLGMGLLVGIAQWVALQRHLSNASWWIVSTVLGWGMLWAGTTYFFYALMGPAL
jgi:hypothetical protein